jgi:hypothetical protein
MVRAKVPSGPGVKECCQQHENLVARTADQREDLAVLRCRECGCRHFTLLVDPGEVAAQLAGP